MIKSYFFIILLSCLVIGCKPAPNGAYLIYKAERATTIGRFPDTEASEKLVQKFQGQEVELKFTSKYITLKESGSSEEMILNLNNEYPSSPKYEFSYNKGGEEIMIDMRLDSDDDEEVKMFITVHPREHKMVESPNYGKFAMIECYLEKVANR